MDKKPLDYPDIWLIEQKWLPRIERDCPRCRNINKASCGYCRGTGSYIIYADQGPYYVKC